MKRSQHYRTSDSLQNREYSETILMSNSPHTQSTFFVITKKDIAELSTAVLKVGDGVGEAAVVTIDSIRNAIDSVIRERLHTVEAVS